MTRIKGFFTFAAFIWLWGCGIWALWQYFASAEIAWLGVLINAWAMPLWMVLRFFRSGQFAGEQWEPKAFAVLLVGLGIALLTASEQSLPMQLTLYNLFIVLIYLFHWSAVSHPAMPPLEQLFPPLSLSGSQRWPVADSHGERQIEEIDEATEGKGGYLLVMLRGTFCADSRAQVCQLAQALPRLKKSDVELMLVSTEQAEHWHHLWPGDSEPQVLQLAPTEAANAAFIEPAGVPIWLRLLGRLVGMRAPSSGAACRPSAWLLDDEGYVVWRHLPANYRMPGSGEFLCGQVSRLED